MKYAKRERVSALPKIKEESNARDFETTLQQSANEIR